MNRPDCLGQNRFRPAPRQGRAVQARADVDDGQLRLLEQRFGDRFRFPNTDHAPACILENFSSAIWSRPTFRASFTLQKD